MMSHFQQQQDISLNTVQPRPLLPQQQTEQSHYPHYTINTHSLTPAKSYSVSNIYYSDRNELPVSPSSAIHPREANNSRTINSTQKKILNEIKQQWSNSTQQEPISSQPHRSPTDPLPTIPIRGASLNKHLDAKVITPTQSSIIQQKPSDSDDHLNNSTTPVQRSKTFSTHSNSKSSNMIEKTAPVTPPPSHSNSINSPSNNTYADSSGGDGLGTWNRVTMLNLNTTEDSNLSTNEATLLGYLTNTHSIPRQEGNSVNRLKTESKHATAQSRMAKSADQILNSEDNLSSTGGLKSREESLGILRRFSNEFETREAANSSAFSSPTNRAILPSPTSSQEELVSITGLTGGIATAKRSSSFNLGQCNSQGKQITPRHEKVRIISNSLSKSVDNALTSKKEENEIFCSVNDEPIYAKVSNSAKRNGKSIVYGEKLIKSKSAEKILEPFAASKRPTSTTVESSNAIELDITSEIQCSSKTTEDMASFSEQLIEQLKCQRYVIKPFVRKHVTQNARGIQSGDMKFPLFQLQHEQMESSNSSINNRDSRNKTHESIPSLPRFGFNSVEKPPLRKPSEEVPKFSPIPVTLFNSGVLAAKTGNIEQLKNSLNKAKHFISGLEAVHLFTDYTTRNNLFHIVCRYGHSDCLAWLIADHYSDACKELNTERYTPATLAIRWGFLECIIILVLNGHIPIVMPLLAGESLLHHAAFHGHANILQWLLNHMKSSKSRIIKDTKLQDCYGVTPAHFAAQQGHINCLQLFQDHMVDLWHKDDEQRTPNDWAELSDQKLCLNYLFLVESVKHFSDQLNFVKKAANQAQEKVRKMEILNNQLISSYDVLKNNYEIRLEKLQKDFLRISESLFKESKLHRESYEKYKTARYLLKNLPLNIKEKSSNRRKCNNSKELVISNKNEESTSTDVTPKEHDTNNYTLSHETQMLKSKNYPNKNNSNSPINNHNDDTVDIPTKPLETNLNRNGNDPSFLYKHDDKLSAIEEMSIRTSNKDSIQQNVSNPEDFLVEISAPQNDPLHNSSKMMQTGQTGQAGQAINRSELTESHETSQLTKSILRRKHNEHLAQTTLSRLKEGSNSLYRTPSPDPFKITNNSEYHPMSSPYQTKESLPDEFTFSNRFLKEEVNERAETISVHNSKLGGSVKNIIRRLFISHSIFSQRGSGKPIKQFSQKIKSEPDMLSTEKTVACNKYSQAAPGYRQAPNPPLQSDDESRGRQMFENQFRKKSFLIATSGNPPVEESTQLQNSMYFSNPSIHYPNMYGKSTRMQQTNRMPSPHIHSYAYTDNTQQFNEFNFAPNYINTANNEITRIEKPQDLKFPYKNSSKRLSLPAGLNVQYNNDCNLDISYRFNTSTAQPSHVARVSNNAAAVMRRSTDGRLIENPTHYDAPPTDQAYHRNQYYLQYGSYDSSSLTRNRRYTYAHDLSSPNSTIPRDRAKSGSYSTLHTQSSNNYSPYFRGFRNSGNITKNRGYPSVSDL